MSSFMQGLKNLQNFWIFRNKTNFTIFFTGFSSTGYFIARYTNEKRFEHPIVLESTRLLQKNSQILELVGYPISVESGLGSRAYIEPVESTFVFKAKGPRGYVQIEMDAVAKTYEEINQMIDSQCEKEWEKYKQEIENQNKKGKISEEELKQQLHSEQSQIIKKEYYILDTDIFKEITSYKDNQEGIVNAEIKPTHKFWKIKNLTAELGSQYKIQLIKQQSQSPLEENITQEKKIQQEKQRKIDQQISKNNSTQLQLKENNELPYFQPSQRKNLNDLLIEEQRRKGLNIQEDQIQVLSEQELEEMRKFKMQQLYKKIGYIRFYMMVMAMGGVMGIYTYVMKNKRINIVGSQIHLFSNQLLQRHPFVKQHLGNNIKFSQSLRGAQIGNKAEFENDLYGERAKATAKIIGEYNEKLNEWNLQKIDIEVFDFSGKLLTKQKIK